MILYYSILLVADLLVIFGPRVEGCTARPIKSDCMAVCGAGMSNVPILVTLDTGSYQAIRYSILNLVFWGITFKSEKLYKTYILTNNPQSTLHCRLSYK